MFKPSAAPRWKRTIRRFLPGAAVSEAYTARARKLGTTLVPTMASAPFFKKTLRVIDMVSPLAPLKFRRAHDQAGDRAIVWLLVRIVQATLGNLWIDQLFL